MSEHPMKGSGWPSEEEIARIIDPSSWRVMDAELARVNRIPNAGYDPDNFKHQGSLAKARDILTLFPPPLESGWRLWSEVAQPMRRIIAMYDDGSGACIYFHAEDGVLYGGEDGCEYQWAERDCFSYWAYLPRGYRLHVEDSAEPMTFPPEPKGPGDE